MPSQGPESISRGDGSRKILLDAQLAFDRGDYAEVRKQCQPLVSKGSVPEDVQRDARDLLGRIGFDRAAVALALVCAVFFLVVVLQYVVR